MVKIGNALRNEIEKVALSGKTLASFARKKETQNVLLEQARKTLRGYKDIATRDESAIRLGHARRRINSVLEASRGQMSTGPIRELASNTGFANKMYKSNLIQAMKNPVVNY